MNKKGVEDERLILWPFYIIIIAFIVIVLITWTNSKITGRDLDKEFLVRDIAFVIDTVAISKNDISVKYNLDNEFYFFIGEDNGRNVVKVIEKGVENEYVYHYYKSFGSFDKPDYLKIEKRNGEIVIDAGKNE